MDCYLRTLKVRASIHNRLCSMLAHLPLSNCIEKMSDHIHYEIILHSLTFLINSRFPQFCDTDVLLPQSPLLPKLHEHFAEFLKCCSPIALAFSAVCTWVRFSTVIVISRLLWSSSLIKSNQRYLANKPSRHRLSLSTAILETASINEISSSVENLTYSANTTILK